MVTNKIDERGFVTEGPVDESSTLLVGGSGSAVFNQPILANKGIINYATLAKRQIFHLANQSFTGSTHDRLEIISSLYPETEQSVLSNIWDFANQKFTFPVDGAIYTIRLDGIIPTAGVSGDPVFHIDFEVSGVISTTAASSHDNETMHRQTADTVIKTLGPSSPNHVHFHAVLVINTDSLLVASGAQMYVAQVDRHCYFLPVQC